jgi:hypothetical protein
MFSHFGSSLIKSHAFMTQMPVSLVSDAAAADVGSSDVGSSQRVNSSSAAGWVSKFWATHVGQRRVAAGHDAQEHGLQRLLGRLPVVAGPREGEAPLQQHVQADARRPHVRRLPAVLGPVQHLHRDSSRVSRALLWQCQ